MKTPFKVIVASVLVSLGIGTGVYVNQQGGSSPPPPPGMANLWVDTNGGTCTRSSSAVAYADAAACSTIAAAWTAMSAGDTTRIVTGDYTSGCSLSGAKAAETFIIGNGSATRLICHVVSAQRMTLQDTLVQEFSSGGDNSTLTNVDITCQDSSPFTLYSPANLCSSAIHITHSNFVMTGGQIGPSYDASDCGGGGPFSAIAGGGADPVTITFTDVKMHSSRNTGCSSQHSEVLRIDGGDFITLNRIYMYCGGTTGLLYVSTNGNNEAGGASDNLTIKNSLFRDTGGCATAGDGGTQAIDFVPDDTAGPPDNVRILNVISHGQISFDTGQGSFPGSVIANTVWRGANPCPSGVATFSHNAPYQPNTGGSTDRCGSDANQIGVGTTSDNEGPPSAWFTCGASCVGATPANHSLAGGSPLINAGDNTYNPGSDYGGIITRPCGGTVEIGIWESGC